MVAAVVIVRLLIYKVRHPHTKDDLMEARKDSLKRSRSVVSGQVLEHIAPLFPAFIEQFNPRDARFLGAPIDFVVFDGLTEGEGVRRVVFVEVKTGKAGLHARERRVRDAIEAGRVEYQLVRLPGDSSGDIVPSIETPDAPRALRP
jgi:predicted Holliday junction resolvase-like endonuclease